MLKRLYVDNYRCFVNFDAHFGPRQLLLGSNGSGKTTVFEILALLRDFCVRGGSADRFVGSTRTRWQTVSEQVFELDVAGNGGEYSLRLVVDSWGRSEEPVVLSEEVHFCGKPIFQFINKDVSVYDDDANLIVSYPCSARRSALATTIDDAVHSRLSWFKGWLNGLLIVAPDPKRMANISDIESKNLNQSLSNFADWYRHIRLDTDDRDYLKALSVIFDGFDRFRFEDAGTRRRELKACFRNGNNSTEYVLDELSDGQRVLIGLYAILYFALKPGATVCFDEPDNFIALREIQPWLLEVLDRTEEDGHGAQVLIASHHPELLNYMGFKEGIRLDRPEGRQVRAERFTDPSSTGLSAAELVARGWEM